ncbi:hypothetical protein [Halobaculum lipolyticum]|uniref:Uncharacterized protein n=1 Tax=Halobaculum lipolyticum TaxID=3032001 RepID=A0ABD5WB95_9EURY|nr:hypothetical protein [Halobaculum sp. DT31]
MITNREIASRDLLDEAFDEVIESARSNGFSDEELASLFADRAAALREAAPGSDTDRDDAHR